MLDDQNDDIYPITVLFLILWSHAHVVQLCQIFNECLLRYLHFLGSYLDVSCYAGEETVQKRKLERWADRSAGGFMTTDNEGEVCE